MQTLVVNGTLPTLNKYMNAERTSRYIAADIKKQATEFVWWQVKGAAKVDGLADYIFTWHVKDKRTDPDNIAFAVKFIFDALVLAKVIPNDTMAYVKSISHYFEVDSNPRVEIQINAA